MRYRFVLSLVLTGTFVLAACGPDPKVDQTSLDPTATSRAPGLSAEVPAPTLAPTITSITVATTKPPPTLTPTLASTLEPDQAELAIKQELQGKPSCAAPCFFAITPDQTTVVEAVTSLAHFGLALEYSGSVDERAYYGTQYTFDNGLGLLIKAMAQDDVIRDLRILLDVSGYRGPRFFEDWSTFSPETLIKDYGLPSSIEFFVGRNRDYPSDNYAAYTMVLRFPLSDLIVEYGGAEIAPGSTIEVCPLADEFQSIRIWMGSQPEDPPLEVVPLEDATSLTASQFADILRDDPPDACFNLNGDKFP